MFPKGKFHAVQCLSFLLILYRTVGCCPYNLLITKPPRNTQKSTSFDVEIRKSKMSPLYSSVLVMIYLLLVIADMLISNPLFSFFTSTERLTNNILNVARAFFVIGIILFSQKNNKVFKHILNLIQILHSFEHCYHDLFMTRKLPFIIIFFITLQVTSMVSSIWLTVSMRSVINATFPNIWLVAILMGSALFQQYFMAILSVSLCLVQFTCQGLLAVNVRIVHYMIILNLEHEEQTEQCHVSTINSSPANENRTSDMLVKTTRLCKSGSCTGIYHFNGNSASQYDITPPCLPSNRTLTVQGIYSIIDALIQFQILMNEYFSTPLLLLFSISLISSIVQLFFAFGTRELSCQMALSFVVFLELNGPLLCVLYGADSVSEQVS